MIRRHALRAAALVLALASTAHADPPIAAVVPAPGDTDVRAATLIGPSGQLYAGDGAGRWVRRAAGGISADVTAAIRAGTDLIVAGDATPLYRYDGTAWSPLKLGQNGRVVLGRGPTPSVAIGKHVFVEKPATATARAGWTRVVEVPLGPIIALWASPKKVLVVTAAGVHTVRQKQLVRTGAPVDSIVGDLPWGISPAGATDLARNRDNLAAAGTIAGAAGAASPWLLTSDGTTLRLAGRAITAPVEAPVPAGTALAGVLADRADRILLVTTDGAVHVFADGAWSSGTVVDELPAARPGPGPAPTS